jgi:hypothetical protein
MLTLLVAFSVYDRYLRMPEIVDQRPWSLAFTGPRSPCGARTQQSPSMAAGEIAASCLLSRSMVKVARIGAVATPLNADELIAAGYETPIA